MTSVLFDLAKIALYILRKYQFLWYSVYFINRKLIKLVFTDPHKRAATPRRLKI
jgi:hypothetical protein